VPNDQPEGWRRAGIDTGPDFGEGAAAKFHTADNIQRRIELEVAELNVAAFAGRCIEALMDKVERGATADVGRPAGLAAIDGQTVGDVEIEADHVRDFTPRELGAGPEGEIAAEDGSNARLNAERDQFGIEGDAAADTEAPAPNLLFDAALKFADLRR